MLDTNLCCQGKDIWLGEELFLGGGCFWSMEFQFSYESRGEMTAVTVALASFRDEAC